MVKTKWIDVPNEEMTHVSSRQPKKVAGDIGKGKTTEYIKTFYILERMYDLSSLISEIDIDMKLADILKLEKKELGNEIDGILIKTLATAMNSIRGKHNTALGEIQKKLNELFTTEMMARFTEATE